MRRTSSSPLPYTPEEHRVLASYFEREPLVPLDPELTLEVALRRLGYRRDGKDQSMAEVAVAGMVLQEIYRLLPQYGFLINEIDSGECVRFREFPGRVPIFMDRFDTWEILMINWATNHLMTFPEAYWLAWLPGYERWVVTRSDDAGDMPTRYPDTLLGSFTDAETQGAGAARLIEQHWRQLRELGQKPWRSVLSEGHLMSAKEARSIGARVWPRAQRRSRHAA